MGDKRASEEMAHSAVLLDDDEGWLEDAERVLTELSVEVVSKERNPRSALSRIRAAGVAHYANFRRERPAATYSPLTISRCRTRAAKPNW